MGSFGFDEGGISAGSAASKFQSLCYGANTPEGGCFAKCQSSGARGFSCSYCFWGATLVMFILGVIVLSMGVILLYYPESINQEGQVIYYNSDLIKFAIFSDSRVLIAVGFFMCFSAIICYEGVCKVVAFVFYLTAFGCIIASIVTVSLGIKDVTKDSLEHNVNQGMVKYMRNFQDDNTGENVWNYIQRDFKCCGIYNFTDWTENNRKFINDSVPDTCCKVELKGCRKSLDKIYTNGCFELFVDSLSSKLWIAIICLIVLIIMLVIALISCCRIFLSNDYSRT